MLEPLQAHHEEGLFVAAQDPRIWEWLAPIAESHEYFSAWLSTSLADSRAGANLQRRLAAARARPV